MALLCAVSLAFAFGGPEEDYASEPGDPAWRPDPFTLCIATTMGDTLVFTDTHNDSCYYSDDFRAYKLLSRLPERNFWVIEICGYEWRNWILVNGENGSIDSTISAPLPSPDGTRFVCAMDDISSGFMENGIQVWRFDSGGLVLEFEDISVPWGPTSLAWESDREIVFEKLIYGLHSWEFETRPGRLSLSEDGIWVPDDPAEWE